MRGDGLVVVGVGDNHLAEALLEVGEAGRKAENCHDFARDGDLKAVLAGHAAGLAAKAVDDVAELAVVHIDSALPHDLAGVDAEHVALLDVVVEKSGQQVVGSADGVEVAGEVQVDILHGDDLSVAAAGSAALDAEHGAERGLAQADHGVFAELVERVGKADGRGGLALARGGGADSGDEDQLCLAGQLADLGEVELCLIFAVEFQMVLVDPGVRRDLGDLFHFVSLSDLNIG